MVPIQNTLATVLAAMLENQPMSPAKLAFAWRVAVGPALDRATRIHLAERGVLRVEATTVAWQREVERSRELVLSRLQRLLGPEHVRRIVVRASDS